MYDEDENDRGFWDNEPTRPLERISHRLKPAGNPPPRPTRPWQNTNAGRRSHTGEIPVVPVTRRGPSRPSTQRGIGDGLGDMAERLLGAARNVRRPQGQPRTPREGGPRTFAAGIDPLMRRLGSLVLVIVLAIPVAIALRSGSAEGQSLRPDTTAIQVASTPAPSTAAPVDTGLVAATLAIVAATEPVATPAPTAATPPATQAPATTPKPAPVCKQKYTVVRGDSWSRIAGKVDVSTREMLDANNATARTLLLPGKTVCLPGNATPTTTAPPTTAQRPTPTTAKPAPSNAPPANTTPALTKTRAYSKAEVEAIIRSVWPAELVDWALKQAWKESNYDNNAYNSCCYGLYQLNFNAHKTWLARCGVTTPSQLFDPRVNAEMGVIVFRRMGGQGPWTGPIPCA